MGVGNGAREGAGGWREASQWLPKGWWLVALWPEVVAEVCVSNMDSTVGFGRRSSPGDERLWVHCVGAWRMLSCPSSLRFTGTGATVLGPCISKDLERGGAPSWGRHEMSLQRAAAEGYQGRQGGKYKLARWRGHPDCTCRKHSKATEDNVKETQTPTKKEKRNFRRASCRESELAYGRVAGRRVKGQSGLF